MWLLHLGLCVALGKAVSPSGPGHRCGGQDAGPRLSLGRMLTNICPWAAVRISQVGSREPRGVENGEGKARSGLTLSRAQSEETKVPRGKMPGPLFGRVCVWETQVQPFCFTRAPLRQWLRMRVYPAGTVGWVPHHGNKPNIAIKRLTGIFRFPRAHKTHVYTTL